MNTESTPAAAPETNGAAAPAPSTPNTVPNVAATLVTRKVITAENTGTKLDIEYSKLVRPKDFNVRSVITAKAVSDLKVGIVADGLSTPLEVRPELKKDKPTGRYLITKGYTRHEALGELIKEGKWEGPIPCLVKGYLHEGFALLGNLAENKQRTNVRLYDEAKRYAVLEKDHAISRKAMAASVGVTDKQIGLLIRCYNNLHPTILECWANPEAQAELSLPLLQQWVPLPQDEQLARFMVHADGTEESEDGEGEDGAEGSGEGTARETVAAKAPNKRVVQAKLDALLESAKDSGEDATVKAQIGTLKWVLGLRKRF